MLTDGWTIQEKALSQCLVYVTLIALTQTIGNHRKAYYQPLEVNNQSLEMTNRLIYFSKTVLKAQTYTQD